MISRRNLLLTVPGAAIGSVVVGGNSTSADESAAERDEKLQAARKRLMGKWKSDVKKSMEFNDEFVKLTKEQDHFLRNFLGRMTIEFEERSIECQMAPFKFTKLDGELFEEKDGWDERNEYDVLGYDEINDCISYRSTFAGFESVSTIFFEDEHLWTYSPGFHIREYFKRVT